MEKSRFVQTIRAVIEREVAIASDLREHTLPLLSWQEMTTAREENLATLYDLLVQMIGDEIMRSIGQQWGQE